MPATWIDAYLARIGYDGPREPSADVLRALHERHLLAVPFENLDIHWRRPIVVDEARFLRKILEERRGGFCYELNGAFAALLGALGFEVALLSARVPTASGGMGPPFDHMTLVVRAGEGTRWLADVGFGDSFFSPLRLEERGEQVDRNGVYRLEEGEEWRLLSRRGEGWALEYLFTLAPQPLGAFAAMCDYQQFSPESAFTKKKVCTRATAEGRITLSDGKLIVTRLGVREEQAVDAAEWEAVLEERFGIRRRS